MTLPTILIASTPDQAEVRALLEHLTEDEYLLLDDDWLQRNEVVEWRLEQDGTQTSRLGKTVLDFEALQSIYVLSLIHI